MQGPLSKGFPGSPERQNTWSSNDWSSPFGGNGGAQASSSSAATSALGNGPSGLLDEARVPAFYERAWEAASAQDGSDYVTYSTVKLMLQDGEVKQSVQDKILSLVSGSSSSSSSGGHFDKQAFYTTLAMLAFAQTGKTVSIDSVAASRDSLPTPNLPSSYSSSPTQPPPRMNRSSSEATLDPWGSSGRSNGQQQPQAPPLYSSGLASIQDEALTQTGFGEDFANGSNGFAAYGSTEWDLGKQDRCTVVQNVELGGWILHHTLWTVTFERTGKQVDRRYNDFVWLHDCFVRRYPFRLLPALPPKRVAVQGRHLATDDLFLERRRRGLERFLTYAVNHPVLKHDGLLKTFLTEADLTSWRKTTPVSLEEESASRTLSPSEEMSVPSDLEDRLHQLKGRIVMLVDHWTRIVQTYDRIAHRRRNQAADMVRFKAAMEGALEVERSGWRLDQVQTIEAMQETVADGLARQGEIVGASAERAIDTTVEELKRHRELYVHFKDLFIRHAALSPDAIDKLKKKTEANLKKLEALRGSTKPGSEGQAEGIVSAIEADQKTIESLLKRRIFIRYCMWQELVFLWRSTSLLSPALREMVKDEIAFGERLASNARSVEERLARE